MLYYKYKAKKKEVTEIMENEFELYFSDLTETAQKEILEKAGIEKPEQANWDVFPITTIVVGESED